MISSFTSHDLVVSAADFGAVPNTDVFQDEYIQKAIDHCFLAGGGEVLIPTGRYNVRGMRLRSNVTLHLLEDAVLVASRNPDDYFILKHDTLEPVTEDELDESCWVRKNGGPGNFHIYGGRWHNAIIRAYHAENIAVLGEKGSLIDGMNCYDAFGEEYYRGPHGIGIINCRHVVLRGYSIQNTGNWAHEIQNTQNILAEDISAFAGHDGIHMTTCDDIIIRRCAFYTGDDCVAGFDNRNVLVEECILNTACSAFRFGGTNVLIHHCRIFAPAKHLFRGSLSLEEKISGINADDTKAGEAHRYNMLSLFTYYADHSVAIRYPASNIIIRDCTVDNADRFLHFNYSGNETWQNNKPLLEIKFENITATGISMPLTAYGDAASPVELTFENVDFSFREGFEKNTFIHTANFKKIILRDVLVRNFCGEHFIKSWSPEGCGGFVFDHLCCNTSGDLVLYTDEEFVCKPI